MTQIEAKTMQMRALFVAWQDHDSRRYFPVGRLVRLSEGDKHRYEFCYLKGHRQAEDSGFRPLLAFPKVTEVYRSDELFPLFENRLMPRKRPDFGEHVARIDLTNDADDFEILARNGGKRATDSLELFPMPQFLDHYCYVTHFLAHGIRYLSVESQKRIDALGKSERLFLMADFQNEADPEALAIRSGDRLLVGYLPRYILPDAWKLQSECPSVEITVNRVNLAPAPVQQRLLCRMESCWPSEFQPYCGDKYEPVADSATKLDCPRPNPT